MASTVDGLRLRRLMGKENWRVPRPWGGTGWAMSTYDGSARVIVTADCWSGVEWIHASMDCRAGVPDYADLKQLHRAVFGEGWAYQIFAPTREHINIHPRTLHLWGRADGAMVTPHFGARGSI